MKEVVFIFHNESEIVLPYGDVETYTLNLPEVPVVGDSLVIDLDGNFENFEDDMQFVAAMLKKEFSESECSKFEFEIFKKIFYINSETPFVANYAKISCRI